ncbi:MAG: putative rane protein, partial [Caulobacter sp.]|nr:putative rane protein [Caulobacter sp.]
MKFLIAGLMALTAVSAQAGPQDDARFQAIYGDEWRWRQDQGLADPEDDEGFRDRLPAVNAAAQQARLARWTAVLKALDGVAPQSLSPTNQINYAVYRYQVESLAAEARLRGYEMPFNSDSAFWSDFGYTARKTFHTTDDYRNYLKQISQLPRYFDEQIVNMRTGLKRGFSVPKATLVGRDQAIVAVAQANDPAATVFYEPFKAMPASIPADEQARLRAEALATIQQGIIPAYGKLLTFMRSEYVPQARTTLAAEAMPDGQAYYRAQIREYTTLELEPEAVHQQGLAEVAKIRAQMVITMGEAGFQGDLPQFLAFLRSDPRFYAKTPEELLMHAAWIAKRVDGQLGRYFGLLPRNRFTIKPVPADIAPYYTAGRGGADTYWVNTYDLPSRPLYNLTALTLHESAPGHSLQLSLAREQGEQPP